MSCATRNYNVSIRKYNINSATTFKISCLSCANSFFPFYNFVPAISCVKERFAARTKLKRTKLTQKNETCNILPYWTG